MRTSIFGAFLVLIVSCIFGEASSPFRQRSRGTSRGTISFGSARAASTKIERLLQVFIAADSKDLQTAYDELFRELLKAVDQDRVRFDLEEIGQKYLRQLAETGDFYQFEQKKDIMALLAFVSAPVDKVLSDLAIKAEGKPKGYLNALLLQRVPREPSPFEAYWTQADQTPLAHFYQAFSFSNVSLFYADAFLWPEEEGGFQGLTGQFIGSLLDLLLSKQKMVEQHQLRPAVLKRLRQKIYMASFFYHLAHPDQEYALGLVERLLKALPVGSSLLLPYGWKSINSGHAILVELSRTMEGPASEFSISIYNSGAGLNYHHSRMADGKVTYLPVKIWRQIPESRLFSSKFLQTLFKIQFRSPYEDSQYIDEKDIYEGLLGIFSEYEMTLEEYTGLGIRFITEQKHGSCSMQSFKSFLAFHLSLAEYKRLIGAAIVQGLEIIADSRMRQFLEAESVGTDSWFRLIKNIVRNAAKRQLSILGVLTPVDARMSKAIKRIREGKQAGLKGLFLEEMILQRTRRNLDGPKWSMFTHALELLKQISQMIKDLQPLQDARMKPVTNFSYELWLKPASKNKDVLDAIADTKDLANVPKGDVPELSELPSSISYKTAEMQKWSEGTFLPGVLIQNALQMLTARFSNDSTRMFLIAKAILSIPLPSTQETNPWRRWIGSSQTDRLAMMKMLKMMHELLEGFLRLTVPPGTAEMWLAAAKCVAFIWFVAQECDNLFWQQHVPPPENLIRLKAHTLSTDLIRIIQKEFFLFETNFELKAEFEDLERFYRGGVEGGASMANTDNTGLFALIGLIDLQKLRPLLPPPANSADDKYLQAVYEFVQGTKFLEAAGTKLAKEQEKLTAEINPLAWMKSWMFISPLEKDVKTLMSTLETDPQQVLATKHSLPTQEYAIVQEAVFGVVKALLIHHRFEGLSLCVQERELIVDNKDNARQVSNFEISSFALLTLIFQVKQWFSSDDVSRILGTEYPLLKDALTNSANGQNYMIIKHPKSKIFHSILSQRNVSLASFVSWASESPLRLLEHESSLLAAILASSWRWFYSEGRPEPVKVINGMLDLLRTMFRKSKERLLTGDVAIVEIFAKATFSLMIFASNASKAGIISNTTDHKECLESIIELQQNENLLKEHTGSSLKCWLHLLAIVGLDGMGIWEGEAALAIIENNIGRGRLCAFEKIFEQRVNIYVDQIMAWRIDQVRRALSQMDQERNEENFLRFGRLLFPEETFSKGSLQAYKFPSGRLALEDGTSCDINLFDGTFGKGALKLTRLKATIRQRRDYQGLFGDFNLGTGLEVQDWPKSYIYITDPRTENRFCIVHSDFAFISSSIFFLPTGSPARLLWKEEGIFSPSLPPIQADWLVWTSRNPDELVVTTRDQLTKPILQISANGEILYRGNTFTSWLDLSKIDKTELNAFDALKHVAAYRDDGEKDVGIDFVRYRDKDGHALYFTSKDKRSTSEECRQVLWRANVQDVQTKCLVWVDNPELFIDPDQTVEVPLGFTSYLVVQTANGHRKALIPEKMYEDIESFAGSRNTYRVEMIDIEALTNQLLPNTRRHLLLLAYYSFRYQDFEGALGYLRRVELHAPLSPSDLRLLAWIAHSKRDNQPLVPGSNSVRAFAVFLKWANSNRHPSDQTCAVLVDEYRSKYFEKPTPYYTDDYGCWYWVMGDTWEGNIFELSRDILNRYYENVGNLTSKLILHFSHLHATHPEAIMPFEEINLLGPVLNMENSSPTDARKHEMLGRMPQAIAPLASTSDQSLKQITLEEIERNCRDTQNMLMASDEFKVPADWLQKDNATDPWAKELLQETLEAIKRVQDPRPSTMTNLGPAFGYIYLSLRKKLLNSEQLHLVQDLINMFRFDTRHSSFIMFRHLLRILMQKDKRFAECQRALYERIDPFFGTKPAPTINAEKIKDCMSLDDPPIPEGDTKSPPIYIDSGEFIEGLPKKLKSGTLSVDDLDSTWDDTVIKIFEKYFKPEPPLKVKTLELLLPAKVPKSKYLIKRHGDVKRDLRKGIEKNLEVPGYAFKEGMPDPRLSLLGEIVDVITGLRERGEEERAKFEQFLNSILKKPTIGKIEEMINISIDHLLYQVEDFVPCMLQRSVDCYMMRAKNDNVEEIQKIHQHLLQYHIYTSLASHLERNVRVRFEEWSLEEERIGVDVGLSKHYIDLIGNELSKRRYPGKTELIQNPSFARFESATSMRLRKEQTEDILESLERLPDTEDKPGPYKNIFIQRIMAAGKSSVLGPNFVALKADGYHLAVAIFPASLLESASSELIARTRKAFGINGHVLKFTRDSIGYSERSLAWMRNMLHHAIIAREYVIMSPETVQSMLNQFLTSLKKLNDMHSRGEWLDGELVKATNELRKILKLLKERGVAIIDEIHLVFNPFVELNFPGTEMIKADQMLIQWISQIYVTACTNREVVEMGLRLVMNEQANMPVNNIDNIRAILVDGILGELTGMVEGMLRRANLAQETEVIRGKLREILQNAKPEYPDWLEQFANRPDGSAEKNLATNLLLVRQILQEWIWSVWSETVDVDFGRSDRPEIEIIKPYVASKKPNERSDFADPINSFMRAAQVYVAKGLDEGQVRRLLGNFADQASTNMAEFEMTREGEDCNLVFGQCRTYLKPMALKGAILKEALRLLNDAREGRGGDRRRQEAALRLILGYVAEQIFGVAEFYAEQITSNGLDVASAFLSYQGYSGTFANPFAFPHDISSDASKLKVDLGANGQVIDVLLRNNREIHILQKPVRPAEAAETKATYTAEEFLSAVLAQRDQTMRDSVTAIIDIGAYFKEYDNIQVAKSILDYYKNDLRIKGVLFYDKAENRIAFIKPGQRDPLILEEADEKIIKRITGYSMKELFVYYDHYHTTGANIPAVANSWVLSTIRVASTLTDILQGVMRARKLLSSQHVLTVVPIENIATMNVKLGREVRDIQDVLLHSEFVGFEQELAQNQRLAFMKMQNAARWLILNQLYQYDLVLSPFFSSPFHRLMNRLSSVLWPGLTDGLYKALDLFGALSEHFFVRKLGRHNVLSWMREGRMEGSGAVLERFVQSRMDLLTMHFPKESLKQLEQNLQSIVEHAVKNLPAELAQSAADTSQINTMVENVQEQQTRVRIQFTTSGSDQTATPATEKTWNFDKFTDKDPIVLNGRYLILLRVLLKTRAGDASKSSWIGGIERIAQLAERRGALEAGIKDVYVTPNFIQTVSMQVNLADPFGKRVFLAMLHINGNVKRLTLMSIAEVAGFREFFDKNTNQQGCHKMVGSFFLVDMQGRIISKCPLGAPDPPESEWIRLLIVPLFLNGAFEQLATDKWLPMFREWLHLAAKIKMSLFEEAILDREELQNYKQSKTRGIFLEHARWA